MNVLTIDFETYYDADYSLQKMTTEEYVRDPRFAVIGVGVQLNGGEPHWLTPEQATAFFAKVDWRKTAVLAHNTVFDGAILSWRYGVRPALWFDTLSMARPLHAMTVGLSLAALAKHYDLGVKGDEVVKALGKTRADFTPVEYERYGQYCRQDVTLTWRLFQALHPQLPPEELLVIDATIRMFTEPRLVLDQGVLQAHLTAERERKAKLLNSLGGEAAIGPILRSQPKFAALLKALRVEPPRKTSPTTGKETYAFAKTDPGLLELREHPDIRVRTVVDVRLGTKSTIEETRAERLLAVSGRGALPVQLNYAGAHTHRFSGAGAINLQNMPRGGALRRAVCAPEGHVLVACDLSQIEARMLAWAAGQHDLVEAFRQGRDVYSEFATDIFGYPVTKENKTERFVGKEGVLSLGYGIGAVSFAKRLLVGFMHLALEEAEAERIVRLYRQKYSQIPAFWEKCRVAITTMADGGGGAGELCPGVQYANNTLYMPNGMTLKYPNLTWANRVAVENARKELAVYAAQGKKPPAALVALAKQRPEYAYTNRPNARAPSTYIYHAKMTENLIQSLARHVIVAHMVAIAKKFKVVLQVHDEIVCIATVDRAEECKAFMMRVMSTPPAWALDLPVACEANIGPNYAEAK